MMFESPSDYNEFNEFTIRTVQDVLDEYHHHIKFGEDDLILDVGSGSGNVTTEVLVPALSHPNFKLIGVDKSSAMVDFASKRNKDPRVTFRTLDITDPNSNSIFSKEELNPGFDLIFSFYCLNWTNNYYQCYKNIFSLLKPGGQIFILKAGYSTLNEIFYALRFKKKWQPFLKNEPMFKYPYHDCKDVSKECTNILKSLNFKDIICDCKSKPHQIVGPPASEVLLNVMKTIDPNIDKIPKNLRSDYFNDVSEVVNEYFYKTDMLPYDRIVVIARKPLE